MMKKMKIVLLFTLLFTFISCVNDIPQVFESETVSVPSADGNTYLNIDVDSISVARTIIPSTSDYSKSKLTNLTLTGKISGSDDNPSQLAHADTYAKFSGNIPIAVGTWDLTLTAELDGSAFSSTPTTKVIEAGKINYLSFTLSSEEDGGLKITVNFSGEATKVVATLQDANKNDISNNPVTEIEDFTMNGSTSSFVYERSISDGSNKLESGTYFIKFEFYNETVPLNTYRSYVRIASGITTTATISIDLDETYSIEYEYYEGTAEFTESELTQYNLQIVGGTILPLFYSRRSETFTLPDVQLDGYDFTGWTLNDTAITQITKGTVGNLELHANFEATGGGNGGNGGNGGSTPAGVTYVDLGLPSGTLWANMNVGATTVTDSGTEFYWSVDSEKESILANYSNAGDVLLSTDDHATVEWGANWVTPTTEQIQELYNNCYFKPVTSYNGETINGYVVYLAKNTEHTHLVEQNNAFIGTMSGYIKDGYSDSDPHIFLPAINGRNGGNGVWMWSSTYKGRVSNSDDRPMADLFGLDSQWYEIIETSLVSTDENNEYPVRPVYSGATMIGAGSISQEQNVGMKDNDTNGDNLVIPKLIVEKNLVSQYEYEKYMTYYGKVIASNSELQPSETSEEAKKTTPAYFVSWIDAIIYCNLRSKAEGLEPVYSMDGETSITVDNSPWTEYYNAAKDGNGKYYYNSTSSSSSYDYETGPYAYNFSANGYRLLTSAEYNYILTNNPTLITSGTYNEWCNNYSAIDYKRVWFDGTNNAVADNEYSESNSTRTETMSFRVCRKAQ